MKKIETEKLAKVVGGDSGKSNDGRWISAKMCKGCGELYPTTQLDGLGFCPSCHGKRRTGK